MMNRMNCHSDLMLYETVAYILGYCECAVETSVGPKQNANKFKTQNVEKTEPTVYINIVIRMRQQRHGHTTPNGGCGL